MGKREYFKRVKQAQSREEYEDIVRQFLRRDPPAARTQRYQRRWEVLEDSQSASGRAALEAAAIL